jgi:hypothetical protein
MGIEGKSGRWASFMKGSEDCKCPYDDLVLKGQVTEAQDSGSCTSIWTFGMQRKQTFCSIDGFPYVMSCHSAQFCT